jgi:hypothetical protein
VSFNARLARGFCLALTLTGCAKRTQLNYDAPGGSQVSRDRLVDTWSVNGEPVEGKFLEPEPGCYVASAKSTRPRTPGSCSIALNATSERPRRSTNDGER